MIAVATRPRGGDWLSKDLTDARDQDVQVVVSCLTTAEESELALEAELDEAATLGLDFIRVPIQDQGTPRPGIVEVALPLLSEAVRSGRRIVIHCRQGLGRSPLVAAAMLVQDGATPSDAWDAVAHARGRRVPETEQQREWLQRFAMFRTVR